MIVDRDRAVAGNDYKRCHHKLEKLRKTDGKPHLWKRAPMRANEVADKGSLIFYHLCLTHQPGESVSFERRMMFFVYQTKYEVHRSIIMPIMKECE